MALSCCNSKCEWIGTGAFIAQFCTFLLHFTGCCQFSQYTLHVHFSPSFKDLPMYLLMDAYIFIGSSHDNLPSYLHVDAYDGGGMVLSSFKSLFVLGEDIMLVNGDDLYVGFLGITFAITGNMVVCMDSYELFFNTPSYFLLDTYDGVGNAYAGASILHDNSLLFLSMVPDFDALL